jgi:hypothetical protein
MHQILFQLGAQHDKELLQRQNAQRMILNKRSMQSKTIDVERDATGRTFGLASKENCNPIPAQALYGIYVCLARSEQNSKQRHAPGD